MTAAATERVGVVLAGGKSSRMGQDKAGLQLNGESLLLRVRATLLAAGCQRLLLSGGGRAEWPDAHVVDRVPDAGPVGGLISALQWLAQATPRATAVFVPVDAPLLSPALCRALLDGVGAGDGCMLDASPLPVALTTTAAVQQRCAAVLPALSAAESWSIKQFLQPLELAQLPTTASTRQLLLNVNTRAEWESFHREFENRR